jgi:hypothetical protein
MIELYEALAATREASIKLAATEKTLSALLKA